MDILLLVVHELIERNIPPPILPYFQDGILWNQVYCMAVKVFCKVF